MNNTLIKKAFIILFIIISCKTNEKYSRIKIFFSEEKNIHELSKLGIPVDHGEIKKNVYLVGEYSSKEIRKIKKAGFKYEVIIKNLKKNYIEQNKNNSYDK